MCHGHVTGKRKQASCTWASLTGHLEWQQWSWCSWPRSLTWACVCLPSPSLACIPRLLPPHPWLSLFFPSPPPHLPKQPCRLQVSSASPHALTTKHCSGYQVMSWRSPQTAVICVGQTREDRASGRAKPDGEQKYTSAHQQHKCLPGKHIWQ